MNNSRTFPWPASGRHVLVGRVRSGSSPGAAATARPGPTIGARVSALLRRRRGSATWPATGVRWLLRPWCDLWGSGPCWSRGSGELGVAATVGLTVPVGIATPGLAWHLRRLGATREAYVPVTAGGTSGAGRYDGSRLGGAGAPTPCDSWGSRASRDSWDLVHREPGWLQRRSGLPCANSAALTTEIEHGNDQPGRWGGARCDGGAPGPPGALGLRRAWGLRGAWLLGGLSCSGVYVAQWVCGELQVEGYLLPGGFGTCGERVARGELGAYGGTLGARESARFAQELTEICVKWLTTRRLGVKLREKIRLYLMPELFNGRLAGGGAADPAGRIVDEADPARSWLAPEATVTRRYRRWQYPR